MSQKPYEQCIVPLCACCIGGSVNAIMKFSRSIDATCFGVNKECACREMPRFSHDVFISSCKLIATATYCLFVILQILANFTHIHHGGSLSVVAPFFSGAYTLLTTPQKIESGVFTEHFSTNYLLIHSRITKQSSKRLATAWLEDADDIVEFTAAGVYCMKWPRELLRTLQLIKWRWQRRSVGVRRPRCHRLAHRHWHTSFSAPCRKNLPSDLPCSSASTICPLCHCIPGQARLLRKSISTKAPFGATPVLASLTRRRSYGISDCYTTSLWVLRGYE